MGGVISVLRIFSKRTRTMLLSRRALTLTLAVTREWSLISSRWINCNRAVVTRVNRSIFKRLYPTTLVAENGSCYTIRFPAPRKVLQLPVNINLLTKAEQVLRREEMRPKGEVVHEEVQEEAFQRSTTNISSDDGGRPETFVEYWKLCGRHLDLQNIS